MPAGKIHKITILGAGRLATQLGLAFSRKGLTMVQVYNRTPEKGIRLAKRIGASFTSDIRMITPDADLYILAVADSVVEELASGLRLKRKLVAHTSGTMRMDILEPVSKRIGVFYPVQTFSQNRSVDFRKIPLCIEGNSKEVEEQLAELARKLTLNVHLLDSDRRRVLHLGAVFSSNFTNFIYAATEELLQLHDIPFSLLEPLILQTAGNIKQGNPSQFQTGPAVRGDNKVLDKHREMLADRPNYLEIYNLITENIIKNNRRNGEL